MPNEKPARRMTLRQLITHAEKLNRDLIEHCNVVLVPRYGEFRDLSRPVRRRSPYPTLLALHNGLNRLQQTSEETRGMVDYLYEQLQEIREHARRERVHRR
jgi:hypothetical protein